MQKYRLIDWYHELQKVPVRIVVMNNFQEGKLEYSNFCETADIPCISYKELEIQKGLEAQKNEIKWIESWIEAERCNERLNYLLKYTKNE